MSWWTKTWPDGALDKHSFRDFFPDAPDFNALLMEPSAKLIAAMTEELRWRIEWLDPSGAALIEVWEDAWGDVEAAAAAVAAAGANPPQALLDDLAAAKLAAKNAFYDLPTGYRAYINNTDELYLVWPTLLMPIHTAFDMLRQVSGYLRFRYFIKEPSMTPVMADPPPEINRVNVTSGLLELARYIDALQFVGIGRLAPDAEIEVERVSRLDEDSEHVWQIIGEPVTISANSADGAASPNTFAISLPDMFGGYSRRAEANVGANNTFPGNYFVSASQTEISRITYYGEAIEPAYQVILVNDNAGNVLAPIAEDGSFSGDLPGFATDPSWITQTYINHGITGPSQFDIELLSSDGFVPPDIVRNYNAFIQLSKLFAETAP